MRYLNALSVLVVTLLVVSPASAQEAVEGSEVADELTWSDGSARTLPKGRAELGLFSVSRYALTDAVELQSNLLLNAMLPNLGAQVRWMSSGGWTFGSVHALRYTTRLFGFVSRSGTGGFIPANVEPPQMLELDNAILVSKALGSSHTLTTELGVSVVPKFTDGVTPSGSLPTIDFPFLYTRTAAANGGATVRAGVASAGTIKGRLEYGADVELYYNPSIFSAPILEQGAKLAWRISDHVALFGGYRLTVAQYPYGTRLHALPVLDLRVGF